MKKLFIDLLKSFVTFLVYCFFRFAICIGLMTVFIQSGADLLFSFDIDYSTALRFALGTFCVGGTLSSLNWLLNPKSFVGDKND